MRKARLLDFRVSFLLFVASGAVCAQQQLPPGPTPPTTAQSSVPLSQQVQSMPDPENYPLPPPANSCSNPPCLQSYTPPPPQPSTQFNWNAACGSLSTEGGLLAMVPGGQAPGAALGAAGSACKVGVAGAKDGPNAAAAETAKEVITSGAEAAATQATGSELAGKITGEGAGVVMDAGKDLAASPGYSSFNCAKVGQCPGADSGTNMGPQSSSSTSLQQNLSALESDLGVDSQIDNATDSASASYKNQLNTAMSGNVAQTTGQLATASQKAAANQINTNGEIATALAQGLGVVGSARTGANAGPKSPAASSDHDCGPGGTWLPPNNPYYGKYAGCIILHPIGDIKFTPVYKPMPK